MATLAEILKRHSNASRSDIEWLHLLTAEWQLIADLVFADLVLWIKNSDDEFIAAGHARPSSAPTLFYRDITGEVVNRQWARDVKHAMQSGEISEQKDPLNSFSEGLFFGKSYKVKSNNKLLILKVI